MRPQDRLVFARAAQRLQLWLLVRRTNPASLAYIGVEGYVPKPMDCKPKTADRDTGRWRWAGLVVKPDLCPGAFEDDKVAKAADAWQAFIADPEVAFGRDGSRYTVDEDQSSVHYGCLRLDGKYIHGDYDLYDIILAGQECRNLAAVEGTPNNPHFRAPRFFEVRDFINGQIGAPMIQHSGEAQYADHSKQSIDLFGPQGEQSTILNEYSVRAWYDAWKRKTIVAPKKRT